MTIVKTMYWNQRAVIKVNKDIGKYQEIKWSVR